MKEQIILGKEYVKYSSDGDNGYEIHEIVDVNIDDILQYVKLFNDRGKIIFIYDRHRPKDTREITGEINELFEKSGKLGAKIKWNELGDKILKNETRYPSVELTRNKDDKLFVSGIAMVAEPASEEVPELELTSELLEIKKPKEVDMDLEIRKVIEDNIDNEEQLKKNLIEIIEADSTNIPIIIDIMYDVFNKKQVSDEIDGVEEVEDLESKDDNSDKKELESKDDKSDKKELESKDDKSDKKELKIEEEEEELSSIALEIGSKKGIGVPIASSIKKAKEAYKKMKMGGWDKIECLNRAMEEIQFTNPMIKREPTEEELSSYTNKQKELSVEEKLYNALGGNYVE